MWLWSIFTSFTQSRRFKRGWTLQESYPSVNQKTVGSRLWGNGGPYAPAVYRLHSRFLRTHHTLDFYSQSLAPSICRQIRLHRYESYLAGRLGPDAVRSAITLRTATGHPLVTR